MLTPLLAHQWDLQKAAHLLNRAGFGGTPDEIKAFCELGFVKEVLILSRLPVEIEAIDHFVLGQQLMQLGQISGGLLGAFVSAHTFQLNVFDAFFCFVQNTWSFVGCHWYSGVAADNVEVGLTPVS